MSKKNRKTVRPNILVLEGLWNDTADLVELAGGNAVETTPWSDKVLSELESGHYQGLLLTGGSDVNPVLYGEEPHPRTQKPDDLRDSTEILALEYARANGLAVLGICRGSQIMCVSQGGKLVQDIPSFLNPIHTHQSDDHPVFAVPGARSFRRACLGTAGRFTSLHHQCVRRPGRGMRIAARAADGTVEAIESKDGLMLGVQFHPELSATYSEEAFGFFRWLVQTAASTVGGRAEKVDFHSTMLAYEIAQWDARTAAQNDAADSTADMDDFGYQYDSYGGYCGYAVPTRGVQEIINYEEGVRQLTTGKPSRKAGDPALPSMRQSIIEVIEESTGAKPYPMECSSACDRGVCDCGQQFATAEVEEITEEEYFRLREIGAQLQVQRQLEESVLTCPECRIRFDVVEDRDDHCKYVHPSPPFPTAAARFPELEPPVGHPAWERDDEAYEELLIASGIDPRDWEDMDG